jgi:hypothetical protein
MTLRVGSDSTFRVRASHLAKRGQRQSLQENGGRTQCFCCYFVWFLLFVWFCLVFFWGGGGWRKRNTIMSSCPPNTTSQYAFLTTGNRLSGRLSPSTTYTNARGTYSKKKGTRIPHTRPPKSPSATEQCQRFWLWCAGRASSCFC